MEIPIHAIPISVTIHIIVENYQAQEKRFKAGLPGAGGAENFV